MADNPQAGDWVLCRALGFGWRKDFGVGQVERVTAKTVYVKACHRSQFPIDQVLKMADEESARKLLERIVSAQDEAQHRITKAQNFARGAIAAMLNERQSHEG